jgi:hypothetical protein
LWPDIFAAGGSTPSALLYYLCGAISAEGTAIVADYLHKQLGLTPAQVRYMTSAPPMGMQWATQRDAAALGFTWQPLYCRGIIGAFCTWRTCVAHYCLWH